MSRFFTATATCPDCSTLNTLDYPASVNADRREDLRAAILDGSLYTMPCTKCGLSLVFEPHLTYLDMGRGEWILTAASTAASDWREAEADALRVYNLAFGAASSPAARAIGEKLSARLVFGWPALVEKLHCDELGIDDVALEVTKLVVLRDGPAREFDPSRDLRLRARENGSLLLDRVDPATGVPSDSLTIPEALYDAIATGGAGWDGLRGMIAGRMVVDLCRVLRDPGPAEDAGAG